MLDVMNNDSLTRRFDGIDLYLWTRLVAATLALAIVAVLAYVLV